jgi:hypothetical protein
MTQRRLTRETCMKPLRDILDNFNERGELDEPIESTSLYRIPKHQRFFVWEIKTQEKLIKSVFKSYPIPFIILLRHRDNTFTIQDGGQRCTTLKRFYTDKFACDIDDSGNKKKYSELTIDERIHFCAYQIGCDTYLESQIEPHEIVDIFMLLNQGKPLTENEKYYARMDSSPFLRDYNKIINMSEFRDDISLFMGKPGKSKTRSGLSDIIGSFISINKKDLSCLNTSYYKNGEKIDEPINEESQEDIIEFLRQYFKMLHQTVDPITHKPKKYYGKLSSHLGLATYTYIRYNRIEEEPLSWYVKKMHMDKKYEPSTFSELSKGDRRNCQGDSIKKRFIAIKKQYETDADDSDYEQGSDVSESDSE